MVMNIVDFISDPGMLIEIFMIQGFDRETENDTVGRFHTKGQRAVNAVFKCR